LYTVVVLGITKWPSFIAGRRYRPFTRSEIFFQA